MTPWFQTTQEMRIEMDRETAGRFMGWMREQNILSQSGTVIGLHACVFFLKRNDGLRANAFLKDLLVK